MRIAHPDRVLKGRLSIAGSKSESNRLLMIGAYLGRELECQGMSDSNDTVLLRKLFHQIDEADANSVNVIDCEDAGTVCRFLASYLAQREGTWLLTGADRLRQRPIAPLVDALVQLGADIAYTQKEGQLPLLIKDVRLKPNDVEIDISQSSQFASSLLLMLPTLGEELSVRLMGEPSSLPYLDMTIGMMVRFGVKVSREDNVIKVSPSGYAPSNYVVSPDWSSASYWLEAAALSKDCHIVLSGFDENTLQGDSVAAEMFGRLGVRCQYVEDGLEVTKSTVLEKEPVFDFIHNPDLFPAVAVTCAAICEKAVFKGVKNLRYKESDRVEALIKELGKMGAEYEVRTDSVIQKKGVDASKTHAFSTHNDHRIAMSLSMLALRLPSVEILEPDVVKKSYPDFWMDMYKVGFQSL